MRVIAVLIAWLASAGAPAFAQAPQTGSAPEPVVAGRVEPVEGEAHFLDRQRQPRVPQVDDRILEGESIVTGADGHVHLRMEDGGLVAVRPGTRMRITSFRAEGDESDRAVLGLLEGSFRSITGWIAKYTHRNYTVRTPTATIGVRGTDHEPFVIREGSTLGEPGTYDRVNRGATYIETKHGRVVVEPGRAGFAHLRRAERPRLLERVPAHFRPARHNERIARRYEEIQQKLQERREERRKLLQERRGRPGEKREKSRGKAEEPREALEKRRAERAGRLEERKAEKEQRRRELEERQGERRKDLEDRTRDRRRESEERFRERRKDLEERRRDARERRDRD